MIGRREPRRSRALGLLVCIGGCHLAAPAAAQYADQNALTAADDAFGTSVGYQTIGLYSSNDARGFNPQQAGNLRIEGLYYDRETWISGTCMVRDSAMRIGIAAQSYSFSSPTGIADLKLHTPGDKPQLSAVVYRGPYEEASALIEGQAPLTERLSGGVCLTYNKGFNPAEARRAGGTDAGATLRWRPAEGTEIVPFWAYIVGGEHRILPQVYTDAVEPPPLFDARHLASQDFTSLGFRMTNFGVIVRQALAHDWRVTAGVFRSREHDPRGFVEEYLSLLQNRTADHVLDVVPVFTATATSGELRVARSLTSGTHARTLEFTVRGRSVDRDFGGDALIDYGQVSLESPPPSQTPGYATTVPSVDRTRQLDAGVMYQERWTGVGSLGLGLLKSHYQRTIVDPATSPATTTATPWLTDLRFTIDIGAALTVYGSFTQGLEDSALAPPSAANRGEPPASTRTHQVDGGIRYAPSKALTLIVGGFEIHKAYFNLDAANVYTALGRVSHRGVETSVTYADQGLTFVAGGVWLRPRVERTAPEPGATGDVPLGPVPITLTANVDYAPPRWHPWAASLQLNWQSARVSTADDRYRLPPLATVAAGLRYESKWHGHPLSVRFDALNLANSTGLHLTPVGLVLPELGRRYVVTLAFDT